MHEAFYFGPADDQVFAIYHPPAGLGTGELVVICPPLFSEYMRTHLALRELALALAQRGRHVIRIDYRGTGDSARELTDITIADWVRDIVDAANEGRDLAGSTATQLVAVRAGALLAARASHSISDFTRLVLWDPLASGAEYLHTLRRIQRDILHRNPHLPRSVQQAAAGSFSGYDLSPRLVSDFDGLVIGDLSAVSAGRMQLVSTSDDSLALDGVSVHVERFACNWETDAEDLMMPQPVLERVISCVTDP